MSGKTAIRTQAVRALACLSVIAGLTVTGGAQASAASGASLHPAAAAAGIRVESGPDEPSALAPSPTDNVTVSSAAGEESAAIEQVSQQAAADQQTTADLSSRHQELSEQVNADNGRSAALVQADNTAESNADSLQTQMQALSQAIDEHNSEPNTFELPEQQAEADAYQAEAAELNAKKSALNSQVSAINSQLSELSSEENQLADAEDALNADIDTYNEQVTAFDISQRMLEGEVQQAFEEEAAAEQEALANVSSSSGPSTAATEMDAGGDAASPTQEVGQGAQQTADNPGGDAQSQDPQVAAVDEYAEQTGSTVITTQPGTAELTPEAISELPASEAAELGSPDAPYNAVVREKNGDYEAVEDQDPDEPPSPQQKVVEDDIKAGGQAEATVDGKPESIDSYKIIDTDENDSCPSNCGTGTVWDDIAATQPDYPGSQLPRSFVLAAGDTEVWVHGNATEHIGEYLSGMASRGATQAQVNMATQAQLSSLQSAVAEAGSGGLPLGRIIDVEGWELKFSAPREAGQLPALVHALHTG
jgi:hypothetical protein